MISPVAEIVVEVLHARAAQGGQHRGVTYRDAPEQEL
jgi:hypothetical protein